MAKRVRLKAQDHRYPDNPNRVYRVGRLAKLYDVSPATPWRWRKLGKLPEPDMPNGWSQALLDSLRGKVA
jgi:hypothetical protein